ncbi:MAG TPA: MraY family glycosyltransferase [Verrucomicrobiae bacterium]|jgi:UDP-GlcNAc:undecaprenyl-phosphate GlcNAc-1-phosphate transferase|nr:MraY family glycosyltransferase [Verrucomicrobiae bacterium]
MSFPFNLYLAAFLAAGFCSAASFPLWKRWCEWADHMDDPGHRKIHAERTPLAGGPAVMTGFFLPLFVGTLLILFWHSTALNTSLREILQYGLTRRGLQLGAILLGAFAMVLLGWLDDHYELPALPKFAGQCLCAFLIAWSGIRITIFIPSEPVNYLLTVLWILTITNALNFLDNMNGLCTGLGIIASWACAWSAAIHGQYLVALLGFLICGALLGFFPFNFPRAQAFLGDAGSHLVGFLVAVLAILPNFYSRQSPHPFAVLSPVLILAVPLFDLVSVVIIRWRAGKPVYAGDTNHISHRLTRLGFSRSHAVLFILLAHAAFSAMALFLLSRG